MNNSVGFIHAFETSLGKYIYDVNRHMILEISDNLYNSLEISEINNIEALNTISLLKKFGFLKNNQVQKSRHPDTVYIPYYLKNHLDTLSLQVTQNCNLRCNYCVYSGNYTNRTHTNITMSEGIAKRGIDFLIERSGDCSTLFLGFYGGEPLLAYPLIIDCMNYIKKNVPNKEIYFSLTTNGTLLSQEVVDVLINYNIHIMVSLDGPKKVHDESRKFAFSDKGSFDTIIKNLRYIQEKYPDFYEKNISYNIVLHNSGFKDVNEFVKTEPLLSKSVFLVNFITDKYSKKNNANVQYSEETKIQYEYELFLLYAHKIGLLNDYIPSRLVLQDFYKIKEISKKMGSRRELPRVFHRSGVCIPGVQKLFLTANGDFFPCERVNECSNVTKIGDIKNGLDLSKITELTNLENFSSERCRRCWAYSFCGICLSGLEDDNGISISELSKRCRMTLTQSDALLKDYCVLKKLGCDFDSDGEINIVEENRINFLKENETDRSLEKLSIPIIFITEAYSKLIDKASILAIKSELENRGATILLISNWDIEDKKNKFTENHISFHDFWINNKIPLEDKIYYLNKYVKEIEEKGYADLIIITIPGSAGKFSDKFSDGFGINLFAAVEALVPDCTIMYLPYQEYTYQDIERINKVSKNKFIDIDYFNIIPKRVCVDETERNQEMTYLTLDNDIVDETINKLDHNRVFNLNHSIDISRISQRIIEQLESYTYEGFKGV